MPLPEYECHPIRGPLFLLNSPDLLTRLELKLGNDGKLVIGPKSIAVIATGTYTGDGTTSQPITGVGFKGKFVWIFEKVSEGAAAYSHVTTPEIMDDDAAGGCIRIRSSSSSVSFRSNQIISLDDDGFTVDDAGVDGHPNELGTVYNYIVIG